MIAQWIQAWKPILENMLSDEKVLEKAFSENEWFLPELQTFAIESLRDWLDAESLNDLRDTYPKVDSSKNIGLILAGNIPLVGFQDLLAVLLAGHFAVVKASHKDQVLLQTLCDAGPAALKARIRFVADLKGEGLDFLVATGSNNTARQIEAEFGHLPTLIRRNRSSVAILKGNEDQSQLEALSRDVLLFHGMGFRSVSTVFVPQNYNLRALATVLDTFPSNLLAPSWWDVQKYQRAISMVLGNEKGISKTILINEVTGLVIPNFGELNVIRYADKAFVWAELGCAKDQLQCVVGEDFIPFGTAQCPTFDDWADGVDLLEILTKL